MGKEVQAILNLLSEGVIVEGDIVSTGIVVLRAKSNVKGTISTATMVVEAGAVFNGESNMIASTKGVVRPETTEKK